jgi:hypothetical protein
MEEEWFLALARGLSMRRHWKWRTIRLTRLKVGWRLRRVGVGLDRS